MPQRCAVVVPGNESRTVSLSALRLARRRSTPSHRLCSALADGSVIIKSKSRKAHIDGGGEARAYGRSVQIMLLVKRCNPSCRLSLTLEDKLQPTGKVHAGDRHDRFLLGGLLERLLVFALRSRIHSGSPTEHERQRGNQQGQPGGGSEYSSDCALSSHGWLILSEGVASSDGLQSRALRAALARTTEREPKPMPKRSNETCLLGLTPAEIVKSGT
jgi:hypothetical protein